MTTKAKLQNPLIDFQVRTIQRKLGAHNANLIHGTPLPPVPVALIRDVVAAGFGVAYDFDVIEAIKARLQPGSGGLPAPR